MDRNANAAPAVGDASADAERCDAAEHSAHDLPDTLPQVEQHARLPAPGDCVAGKYIICDVLGIGGSAIVYAAEQVNLKRVVAFKLYPDSGALAGSLLSRFEREAQLLARVHHENVVAVFDAGSMPNGSPYLVVQRLSGESVASQLAAGPLPVMESVALTRQVLKALAALSDAGIVHRDIKPGNLVLDRLHDGRTVLKLVDFGVAKETHDESSRMLDEMVGTPGYMAPEQVLGENIDARCDLYALGATLYEMLTGQTPHSGDTVQEIARATLFAPITAPSALRADCPEGLSRIVMKALAREPSQRFASAREMLSTLDRWLVASVRRGPEHDDGEDTLRISFPTSASPLAAHGPRATRRKLTKRSMTVVALAALLVLVLPQNAPLALPQLPMHASTLACCSRASTLFTELRSSALGLVEVARRFASKNSAPVLKSRISALAYEGEPAAAAVK